MPRPRFKPTEEQRALVKSLASIGLPQEEICTIVRLRSAKTLRKCFPRELAQGLAEATAIVAQTAYDMAISGEYPAMTFFWLKCQVPSGDSLEMQQEQNPMHQRSSVVIFRKPKQKE